MVIARASGWTRGNYAAPFTGALLLWLWAGAFIAATDAPKGNPAGQPAETVQKKIDTFAAPNGPDRPVESDRVESDKEVKKQALSFALVMLAGIIVGGALLLAL